MKPVLSTAIRSFQSAARQLYRHKLKSLLVVVVGISLYFWLAPPEIGDLSEENRHYTGELLHAWQDGEVIVLLRHLERCDRYDLPCLTAKEGITARSTPVAQELRDDFYQLGLSRSDIYNSPLLRTAETEALVFDDIGEDRDWLIHCEQDFLGDALKNKQKGRNLVLVTHSHCIKRFQKALEYDEETPLYGSALFFAVEESSDGIKVLGFLDADDWESTLGF